MYEYLRCTNCGYDLYGPECLVNSIDTQHEYAQFLYTNKALLTTCTKSESHIECPFCHSQGTLTR